MQYWLFTHETLPLSIHTVPVTFCTMPNRPNMGNLRKARFIWVEGFRVISVHSPWFSPFRANRESFVVVAEGACGRGYSPCDRWEAERRNTGQGRAGYSLPQTSSLATHFFHQVPAPSFSPSPSCTIILEVHQGFTHRLEHSSQDTIISQKTMSSAQVLGP